MTVAGPIDLLRRRRWWLVGALALLEAAVLLVAGPILALVLLVAAFLVVLLTMRPHWAVYAVIVLGITTFPAVVPYQVDVGPVTVFLFEPFLVVAAIWSMWVVRTPVSVALRVIGVLSVVAAWSVGGMLARHPVFAILNDIRGLVDAALALLVASAVVASPVRMPAVRLVRVSMWWSALLTLVASVTGLELAGRSASAALYLANGDVTGGGTRYLTASAEAAAIVLALSCALVLTGTITIRTGLSFAIPSGLLTALGFSRNSLLALAVTLLVALLWSRSVVSLAVLYRGLAAAVLVVAAVAAGASAGLAPAQYVVNQAAVFNDRVVSGLNSVTINEDTSVRARAREDAYALKAAGSAPVLGHGFGYAYQPAFGEPGHFAATRGQYYAHNFYLWLLMKTGAIGLLLMLWIMLAPAVRGLFSSSSVSRAVAATGLGLLTSMVFAPYPNDPQNGGSLAAGAVLGLLAWAVARAADGTGDPGAPEASAAPAERVPAEA